ncbi:DUF4491 family protein [Clostridium botulinum]|uniref:Membrane protein n=1 Tax=Clostridium botulinum C/D str. DC5 TaxID=1443128 RepID=A0A0A0IEL2_CLOBO|nr:DUF4491 family protein [Clostridium botulinum]KEI05596.1 membrane protein [Clostridium botulinum C/D str. BKT75002]KEI09649.1 membrane protein [Clostridium botulinum C/D str. BKT2873]KGM95617.1 membrane protein [Clostridium botulinum D str. CCUG 7971]KGM98958.1 membrane protein [Clostridium botulinum C/D str. DC5]KOC49266.1 hypothetical protein ADU88_06600 [Clostridium botulinum]
MNIQGVLIGLIAFLIIGVFHPIVIKGEYYFGKGIWPIFLVIGIIFLVVSIFIKSQIISSVLGVIGFSCLWSIIELFEQEERVKKGWFPKNPKRIDNEKGKY